MWQRGRGTVIPVHLLSALISAFVTCMSYMHAILSSNLFWFCHVQYSVCKLFCISLPTGLQTTLFCLP